MSCIVAAIVPPMMIVEALHCRGHGSELQQGFLCCDLWSSTRTERMLRRRHVISYNDYDGFAP